MGQVYLHSLYTSLCSVVILSEVRAVLRPMLVVQWFNEASKVCPRQRLRRMRSSVRWGARLRLAQCPCLLLVVSASRPLVSCVFERMNDQSICTSCS